MTIKLIVNNNCYVFQKTKQYHNTEYDVSTVREFPYHFNPSILRLKTVQQRNESHHERNLYNPFFFEETNLYNPITFIQRQKHLVCLLRLKTTMEQAKEEKKQTWDTVYTTPHNQLESFQDSYEIFQSFS